MESFNPKEVISTDSPIVNIECEDAWNLLTQKEKMFCYYYSKACWAGQKICTFEKSYESPALFVLLKILFTQDMQELKQTCIDKAGLSEEEWSQLISYTAAVFNNAGNYKSFGDTKFVPQLSSDKFWAALTNCQNYENYKDIVDTIWDKISKEVYEETPPYYKIGFHDNNASSAYYTSNITKEEAEFIDKFMNNEKSFKNVVTPLNTRLFKHEDGTFELKIHSTNRKHDGDTSYLKEYEYEGKKIKVSAGHLDFIFEEIVHNLKLAQHYASNDRQKKILDLYIKHFVTGKESYFKECLIEWIQDKNPAIESHLGFHETYLDPLGVRAEFEGLLAIVDKNESKLYTTLVDNAEKILEYFPWSKDFEKEKFQKPDFTSIKIVAHGSSGVPLGQNLPNYEDMRHDYGFKNYALTNAAPKLTSKTVQFGTEEMVELVPKYSKESLDLKVALHELLGHGSGKLFVKDVETGEFNFDIEKVINPVTNKKIETYYMSNETWMSKFKKLHSAYEECRADTVAMYLSHFKEPYEILFEGRDSEYDDIQYVMWYEVIRRGIVGLTFYDDKTDNWGQAHIIGNYVIMRVIHEAGGVIDIDIKEKDGKETFTLILHRDKIKTDGHEAIKKFLQKLHILKCVGDYDTAQEWFGNYMKVDEYFMRLRSIVMENKLPRRLELQPNLFLTHNGEVQYKLYEESHEGIVRSFVERMADVFDTHMYEEWLKDADKFRIKQ